MPRAPEEVWKSIQQAELRLRGVTAGTGFGKSVGLRITGKVFALVHDGRLVVKLPKARVDELIESGAGRPWGPGARVMKEWVALPPEEADRWPDVVAEARAFVGSN